jgi:endonuclease YncB( thermonuclease family)
MEGYDSWEMKPNKSLPENKRNELITKAHLAKQRLEELILNKNVYIFCKKFDKYGRILASVKLDLNDTKTINDIMIEENHGYVYFGGTKKMTDSD